MRAIEDWHASAIKAAYASGDKDWKGTAVFSMGFVPGFDAEILEALKSADREVHIQAIVAAGRQEVDAAWPYVTELIQNPDTEKPPLLAAIAAAGYIRPKQAGEVLIDLYDSPDEDIAEAAAEAMGMGAALSGGLDEEEPGDNWVN